eukprot:6964768-Pyramimonas_sp.AAC.1
MRATISAARSIDDATVKECFENAYFFQRRRRRRPLRRRGLRIPRAGRGRSAACAEWHGRRGPCPPACACRSEPATARRTPSLCSVLVDAVIFHHQGHSHAG